HDGPRLPAPAARHRHGADGGGRCRPRPRLDADLPPDGDGPVLPPAGALSAADALSVMRRSRLSLSRRGVVTATVVAGLAAVPAIAAALGESFYLDLFTRIMIFAIAALSLDIILGYGGMVSFGHAAYLGIGAYAVGILAFHGVTDGFLQLGAAIAAAATAALFIGVVSLRTSGVYFIMITLAFAQMIYFLSISLNTYGGDNGLNISEPGDFHGHRLVESRFGMALRGARSNPRRMAAIGFPPLRYRLAAFVVAGAMCGV